VVLIVADQLEEHFPSDESERQFKTAVDWGRYAELFEYDAAGGWLALSNNDSTAPFFQDVQKFLSS